MLEAAAKITGDAAVDAAVTPLVALLETKEKRLGRVPENGHLNMGT